jgi:PIN domain nuclease of toxin-antitoxin system
VRFLLDTVTFIWSATSPELISKKALVALRNENAVRELSAISLSEIAIKQSKGKLSLSKDNVIAAIADLRLRILPYTADHAYELFDLPWCHSDPFDRLIIAQALSENIPVVTSDEKFELYEGLAIIW